MKTFKSFREAKHIKEQPLECLETVFGSHSLPKSARNNLETVFGKHSQPKGGEKFNPVQEGIDPIKKHTYTPEEHDHLHNVVAPLHDFTLKKNEIDAIEDYADDSRPLNSMLHQHAKGHDVSTSNTKHVREATKFLDGTLNNHKTTDDMTVFTGLKDTPARHFKVAAGKPLAATQMHLPAFTSTSTSITAAKGFSEPAKHKNDEAHGITYPDSGEANHVLKIHVPKGTHAMSMRNNSFVPEENEILLHRGHSVEIDPHPEHIDKNTFLWSARLVKHHLNDLSKPVK